jgi:hypothetical protein
MKRAALSAVVWAMSLSAAAVLAQTPELSGTWRLHPGRSRVDAAAPLAGLVASGAPGILHVSQPANGSLVVESQMNESHARLYVPGRESTTPIFLGQAGRITMTTRWEGASLVSEGRRETGSDAAAVDVKEVYARSEDGGALELEITVSGPEGESTSRLIYTRIDDTGPCESWPTPCKPPN